MSDDTTQQGQQTSQSTSSSGVFVPEATRLSHGDLINLILQSESMNDEERQYWIDLLPIMTPEQIEQLQRILDNEKTQLATIEEKYSKGTQSTSDANQTMRNVEEIALQRTKKASERIHVEQEQEALESTLEQDILKQVEEV